ncbi:MULTISPECIES: MerR family transcriptional regulator [Pseudovibrio]|uniref:MerR family transcriptional regulator n=1 Tax=Stappiaceae TaxID=2821832 RepID=UPI002366C34F|nr:MULTISPECIES: MerR family transcriptional regulator [Pseudovibrio]MDD7910250.1 MerR family transcriptional regulator [Pseudovibrio exalbescens]MDX5593964.1 MerR family transcriptional regulator [Pseudovibrio sp. SPO723]
MEMNTIPTKLDVVPDIAGPIRDDDGDGQLLAISEMSELFGVTLRTLRFYEEKGLLNPVRRGARRFYRARDVGRMRVILQAKKIGLTLAEVRRIIKLVESGTARDKQLGELKEICAAQEQLLLEQEQALKEQIAEVRGVVSALSQVLESELA